MKNYYLVLFFLLVSTISVKISAQSSSYALKNDTLQAGVKIIHNFGENRFHHLTLIEDGKEVKYSPLEIAEYGEDGKVYVARLNPLRNGPDYVYMERIVHDTSISVFYYPDKAGKHYFFQQRGGELQPINKDTNPYADYIYEAVENSDCKAGLLKDYEIKPTRKSIIRSYKLFSNCIPPVKRAVRVGPWVGAGISHLNSDVVKGNTSEGHFLIGAFLDIPINSILGVSIRPEVHYMKESILHTADRDASYQDVVFNRETVVSPWLVRYTFPNAKGKWLPFLNAGPSIQYVLKKEVTRRTMSQLDSGVNTVIEKLVDKEKFFQLGMAFGAGVEYKLNKKHSLFLDVRYSMSFDKDNANLMLMSVSYNL